MVGLGRVTGKSSIDEVRQKSGGGGTTPSQNMVEGSCPTHYAPPPQPWLPATALSAESIRYHSLWGCYFSSTPCLHDFNHSLDFFTSCLDLGLKSCEKSVFPATSLPLVVRFIPSTCNGLREASLMLTYAVTDLEQGLLRQRLNGGGWCSLCL